MSIYNEQYMREALNVAQEAYDQKEVPVGCVFVKDNKDIIARGRNKPNETCNATRHAEIEAIDYILAHHDKSVFATTDLYVTVEPCIMCASALRQMGIRQVYFGCGNDKFGGNGSVFNIHSDSRLLTNESSSYPSQGGFLYEEAVLLLRKFYVRENTNAPVPKKKANRILKTDVPMISPHLSNISTPTISQPSSSSSSSSST
ncbi:cytidine deaminase-like protein [Halteromyces radiatus]|uniref:cytidine deaminase-like protein n=1 Tax=Halteromyces radiatus TaxID=101107 RepID=UPI002220D1E7|nr:cytidine deaminase-like protein [Halteromyces radiatus]KAI8081647.1 cytidine deaminase-like protein [Halteromyces radiatus]